MWPENKRNKHRKQVKMEKFSEDQDPLNDVKLDEKHWEYKRANVARLLEEELGLLSQQRKEIEQNKQQILEEQRFQDESYYATKHHVPILDKAYEDEWKRPSKKNENIGNKHRKDVKMENFGKDVNDVKFDEKSVHVDFQRLIELTDSEKGQSHLQCLVKHWVVLFRLLRKILTFSANRGNILNKKLYRRGKKSFSVDKSMINVVRLKGRVPVLDGVKVTLSRDLELKTDAEHDSISYWKERAMQLEEILYQEHKMHAECDIVSFWKERVMQLEEKLQACLQRESSLVEKPEGGTTNPLSCTQMDEFSGLLKRADFFLHLVLQSAPIVIAHQDADLRYRFIFNHYPTLADEDVIGKIDYKISSGEGVEKMNSVKREVMATGIAIKREFTFNTPMFGPKTFLIYIEPVFSKAGETIGVNHVAMDVTDQVKRREKMVEIHVREAVQKALESKLGDMKIQDP